MEESKIKMDKTHPQRPLRPILGGTKNGTRPQRYSYWRVGYAAQVPSTLPFWVAQAGEYHCDKSFLAGSFEHGQHYQFYYHLAGEAEVAHKQGCFALHPGDLVLIPHNTPFTYVAQYGLRIHWFALSGAFSHLGREQQVLRLSLGQDPALEEVFVLLRETLILDQPGSALRAVSLVYELLALIEARRSAPTPQTAYPDVVRVALSYIHEQYKRPFVAQELADFCGVSPAHLRFLFQKWVGESPQQSHTRRRIELAERLLTQQDLPIGEVAKRVGYADPYYFSRVFKKQTGVRPSQFRHSFPR